LLHYHSELFCNAFGLKRNTYRIDEFDFSEAIDKRGPILLSQLRWNVWHVIKATGTGEAAGKLAGRYKYWHSGTFFAVIMKMTDHQLSHDHYSIIYCSDVSLLGLRFGMGQIAYNASMGAGSSHRFPMLNDLYFWGCV